MGIYLTKLYSLYQSWAYGPPVRVLLLGLDAAGKTTILYKMKLNEVVTTIPTIGFNVEEVTPMPGITFTVWDVGGQEKIRRLWKHYYQASEGLIFVVDSCDRERMAEARHELENILKNNGMPRGVPFVVLANKQDMPGALGPSKITEQLGLHGFRQNSWTILGTCATTGEGLYEGLEALSKMVRAYRKERVSRQQIH